MKDLRRNIEEKIHRIARFTESYFLGPSSEESPLEAARLLLITKTEQEGQDEFNDFLISNNYTEKSLAILSPFSDPPFLRGAILLRPEYLEQVPDIIEALVHIELLVIDHLSCLPKRSELSSSLMSDSSSYGHELMVLFRWLRDFHRKKGFSMLILEQEDSLGPKNSALLRRIIGI